ncbi:hypothetical protein [Halegenticoccus soli]|uniref:hypothetical protein n=1 Tax=Halegenticoccus soli TaxID=1985678 RepID=UPI001179EAD4|nr:hypothetical protein [Halegenticoccus soli]
MANTHWGRRRILKLAGPAFFLGLAGCSSQRDDAAPQSTPATSRSPPANESSETTPTPTETAQTTETEQPTETPGYVEYHWHGQLFFEIDGKLLDFTQPRYFLETLEAEHPETVYFHFHESAHGPNEWSNEKKVVTFEQGLNLLPGIAYRQGANGNHVVTHEGTTYRETDAGTTISIAEGTREIDPAQHDIQHGDELWVRTETSHSKSATSETSGLLLVDVNNHRIDFSHRKYQNIESDRFRFEASSAPYYRWRSTESVTLEEVFSILPDVRYERGRGGHSLTYSGDDAHSGTYRQADAGTTITFRQRMTDIDPASYQLKNGDIIWVYVHTDTAPDNEH